MNERKPSTLQAKTLTFNRAEVTRALTHTLKASSRSPHSSQGGGRSLSSDDSDSSHDISPAGTPPGLWLSGDAGIYLMSNGRNAEGQHGRKACPVAYAIEANPDTVPFNDWTRIKTEAFHGDGSVFLPADTISRWLAQTFADLQLELYSDTQHAYVRLKDDLHSDALELQ